jgi:hypothetical protein
VPAKKASSKKIERVCKSVNKDDLIQVLKNSDIPEKMFDLACMRIDVIITAIRDIETDIGVTSSGKLLTKNAQSQIEVLTETDKSLKSAALNIKRIDAPRQRYKIDPTRELYYPELGAAQLRNALAHELAKVFSPDFLQKFEINLTDFIKIHTREQRDRMDREPLRETRPSIEFDTYELRYAITREANPIASEILDRIAKAVSESTHALEPQRKKGGKDVDPIKRFLLSNLTQLWNDVFEGRKSIYVDEKYRDFFDFVKGVCRIMGVPSYCTKHQLDQVIPTWKKRSPR